MLQRRKHAPSPIPDAEIMRDFIDSHITKEATRCLDLMSKALDTVDDQWSDRLDAGAKFLLHAGNLRHALRNNRSIEAQARPQLVYQISTRSLLAAYRYLANDPRGHERMVIAAAMNSPDGTMIITETIELEPDKSSAVYVSGDPAKTHTVLMNLCERDGHIFAGMWHNHPCYGAEGTQPSGTDIAHQQRHVEIGCRPLGGIFSLDGFVRFFSTADDIRINLFGNGAEIIATQPRQTLIKITQEV